ncbi:hypothetical protein GOA63_15140 [Sinorhizobium meliloti]|uniref:hypothetical protein n=1 Tax=Rhizobium meliloti TaxID=382 RepID=UPI0012978256|nr:hypothetical protein [Sinorhizobium meliloti]MDW9593542.1 hypothetical protein [Sinorhizobium meliloti]MDX0191710.1 hypothetical protein [Sinorhizobium meliloti]MQV09064.1 hypothetical protein [Sinorhizobium meliloti]
MEKKPAGSKSTTTQAASGVRLKLKSAKSPMSEPSPTRELKPPPGGAAVRMYRIGHGDCFLIAFAGEHPDRPSYVLIDCGYKPKSQDMITPPTNAKAIGADILATTGGMIDVAIITHEHQDHVNGFNARNFPKLQVGEVWFAWTENPEDDVANALRKKFNDRLLGLIDARFELAAAQNDEASRDVDWYLEFELGEQAAGFNGLQHSVASGKDPSRSANKQAMEFLRKCAGNKSEYLYPHEKPRRVPGAKSARVFVLGPPRDPDKIDDLDPLGSEAFGEHGTRHLELDASVSTSSTAPPVSSPFPRRYALPLNEAFTDKSFGTFFNEHYGGPGSDDLEPDDGSEIATAPEWRRIDALNVADPGALALAMNNATNNTSLVLAFELSRLGKILLFVGDAQAGNWRSWSDKVFNEGGNEISAKDLLGRTVLYKVGHHCSHNATLNGKLDSKHPNLAWMAQGAAGDEFVAMITAVEAWAHQKPKPDWNHPMPQIKAALLERTSQRVLQTDTSLEKTVWRSFPGQVDEQPLWFDLMIEP